MQRELNGLTGVFSAAKFAKQNSASGQTLQVILKLFTTFQ